MRPAPTHQHSSTNQRASQAANGEHTFPYQNACHWVPPHNRRKYPVPINQSTYYTRVTRWKIKVLISVDAEKHLNNPASTYDKNSQNRKYIKGTYLTLCRSYTTNLQPTSDSKGDKWKVFPLRQGRRQRWPLSPLLLGVLTQQSVKRKKQKTSLLESLHMTWLYM